MEANITQVELVYFYTFRSILHSKNLVIPDRIRGNTKTERMVKLLSENILTTGRYIYLDHYYVIYQLFKYFSQQNIKATGTARIDRIDLPREEIDVPITVMEYNKNTHGVD